VGGRIGSEREPERDLRPFPQLFEDDARLDPGGAAAALRFIIPSNRGTIVQVGSALAYRGIPLQSAYCAAKHAITGFVHSLRAELLHDGVDVCVTVVQMPALNTPQFDWVKSRLPRRAQPIPPIYQPEIAADAIVFASRAGRSGLVA
jgi:NAD(P)-dependent dehydrogenase (short-subunit alcohol dehydrogenase family)